MKIRLVSKASSKAKNRWSFIYWKKFGYTKNYGETALEIVWPKFLIYSFILAIVGYFAAGGVALIWVHRKAPGNEITYFDVVNPARWPGLEPKVGKAHISMGLESISNGDYSSGLLYLRRGLVRYPQDNDARFILAKFYAESGYRDVAITLLKDSLQYGLPDYATEIIRGALAISDFQQVESSAKELLSFSEFAQDAEKRVFTTRALLISLLEQRKFEEVLQISRSFNAEGDTPVQFVDAEMMALLSLKREPEAMELYDSLPDRARGDLNLGVLSIQAAMLTGDREDTLRRIKHLIPWDDARYWPFHAQTLLILRAIGEEEELSKRLSQYIEQNIDRPVQLSYLSRNLYHAGTTDLLELSRNQIDAENPVSVTMDFHLVQSYLRDGRDENAKDLYESWKDRLPEGFSADEYIEWMDLLIEFSDTSDDVVADSIYDWVSQKAHPHDLYLLTADVLASRQSYNNAELIIREGTRHYTFNEALKRKRARILKAQKDQKAEQDSQRVLVAEDRVARERETNTEAIQQIQMQRMRESSGAADEIARARMNAGPSEVDDELARKRLESNAAGRERVEKLARERLEALRKEDPKE
ncbi:MAG: hypothetical protein ACPGN3_14235 [Opitutales bacterium]